MIERLKSFNPEWQLVVSNLYSFYPFMVQAPPRLMINFATKETAKQVADLLGGFVVPFDMTVFGYHTPTGLNAICYNIVFDAAPTEPFNAGLLATLLLAAKNTAVGPARQIGTIVMDLQRKNINIPKWMMDHINEFNIAI